MVPSAFSADHFFAQLDEDLYLAYHNAFSLEKRYAIERFQRRYLKKYRPRGHKNASADREAIEKFLRVNRLAGSIRPTFSDEVILGEAKEYIHHTLERATYRIREKLFSEGRSNIPPIAGVVLDLPLIFQYWQIGPGSNSGTANTHFVEKMSGKLSTSNQASSYLRYLSYVSPLVFPVSNTGELLKGVSKVRGSKVACVPKTPEISRVIAKEPILNMCCQLAAGNFIAEALRFAGLDIRDQQEKNKLLAKQGSIVGDSGDSLVTLDLESASDLITPQLCEQLLPPEWFAFLSSIRSEVASVPGVGEVAINSMSTMGNGFTFTLMTLLLTSLVYALNRVLLNSRNLWVDWSSNGVFGDDIIVSRTLYTPLVELLTQVGLIVNLEKSFSIGYFRESCGGDYFRGYDVTPCYIKDLTTTQGKIISLNQLSNWSAKHHVWLDSIEYLASSIPRKCLNRVPMWESADAGFQSFSFSKTYKAMRFRPQSRFVTVSADFKLACALGGYAEGDDLLSDSNPSRVTYTPRYSVIKTFRETCHTSTVWSGCNYSNNYKGWLEQIAIAIGL